MSRFLNENIEFEQVVAPYDTPLVLNILPDIKGYGRNTVLQAELDEKAKALAQQSGFRSPESPSSKARRRSKSPRSKRKKFVQTSSLPPV